MICSFFINVYSINKKIPVYEKGPFGALFHYVVPLYLAWFKLRFCTFGPGYIYIRF